MNRLLYRLGKSRHARAFYLKGGVLVANLLVAPHRLTRDIDLLCRRGPVDLAVIRHKFREIVAVASEDGLRFEPDDVCAEFATREHDGYDGATVWIRAWLGSSEILLKIDIGFGDAVVPAARLTALTSFLEEDPPARVYAYGRESVLAEKIETIVSKYPAIEHRLKDILDVVALAGSQSFVGVNLARSIAATFRRRDAKLNTDLIDEMIEQLRGKRWTSSWARMRRDKAVQSAMSLQDATAKFAVFVRPLLAAVKDGTALGDWPAGGPWTSE
jgi:hypothetical protein